VGMGARLVAMLVVAVVAVVVVVVRRIDEQV